MLLPWLLATAHQTDPAITAHTSQKATAARYEWCRIVPIADSRHYSDKIKYMAVVTVRCREKKKAKCVPSLWYITVLFWR